ncbi:MAG TPA: hypothetical protein VHJ83_13750 [Micromonosporaceae bacterium]|jgi:hypothetical protein|nr:hypothetical protein [Micromonosporaceae bacterium]
MTSLPEASQTCLGASDDHKACRDNPVSHREAVAERLRAVLTGQVEQVGDLPGLDPRGQVVLTGRLLREAAVVSVDA